MGRPDEAFAGIDDRFTPDPLGLTVKFDLDLFMTGHDLWVPLPGGSLAAHYDLQHDEATHGVCDPSPPSGTASN